MKNKNHSERLGYIYKMLFEMAQGNFNFRILNIENGDELDEVSIILNEVATKITDTFSKLGNKTPKFIFRAVLQPLLIIENDAVIKNFKSFLPWQLGYNEDEFYKLEFSQILSAESKLLYAAVKETFDNDENIERTIKIVFIGRVTEEIHLYCTVEQLVPGNLVVISSISNLLEKIDILEKNNSAQTHLLRIQSVYNYIVNNIHKPLPSTRELSILFRMNEFQIKEDFRKLYHTSIYQLYTDERLKFAHTLINTTSLSLSDIASESGYSTYLSFYRAFRKKYNCAPTEIKRKDH